MKVLRLLAARRLRRSRAVPTIRATPPATPCGGYGEDEGPFFDLDLSCCSASAPASSAESGSESEDYPSYERVLYVRGGGWAAAAAAPAHHKFCKSEPNEPLSRYGSGRRGRLRTLSFGSAKAAFYGGRASFSRSSNSARSARLFATFGYGSPDQGEANKRTASSDVIRWYLSKISRQLRRVAPGAAAADLRLRKSRSASAAQTAAASPSPPPRRDDSLLEQQDGIASAIAHCKESLHRASVSECDLSLPRSQSDPGR